jgi:hypothetical protein
VVFSSSKVSRARSTLPRHRKIDSIFPGNTFAHAARREVTIARPMRRASAEDLHVTNTITQAVINVPRRNLMALLFLARGTIRPIAPRRSR